MIRVKIRIATTQRAYFDMCMEAYHNKLWLLSSRTYKHGQWGTRDYIELHGNILHILGFMHFLGNKHIRVAVLQYIVTPYPKHSIQQQTTTV